ncbi:unnamed protein product [Heterosigma akashiwo]
MSMCPMVVDGNAARWGVPLGQGLQLEDSLWAGLTDSYAGTPMGVTAENLAEKYGITREECDEYGFRSQMAWGEANKAGVFEAELAPVEVKGRKGPQLVTADESPRPDVQLEKMRSLKPVFKKGRRWGRWGWWRSTRPSRPSTWPARRSLASTAPLPTRAGGPSRWATRWGPRAPASRPTWPTPATRPWAGGVTKALGSACIGGGQGIAVLLEKC